MKARAHFLALACVLAGACSESENDDTPKGEGQCGAASEAYGELVCAHRIDTPATWQAVGAPLDRVDQVRATKFMVPARPSARLAPLFLNANEFPLHYDFMVKAFGDLFPGLTPAAYLDLLFDPARREFYVGDVTEFRAPGGATSFGFTFATDPSGDDGLDCDDVRAVYAELDARLYGEGLALVPSDKKQLEWVGECGVTVRDPSSAVEYEAYHTAVGFGTLRRYDAAGLARATENAEFGFQDLLVLDEAPLDLERVVSGAVTGTRQGPLSHLAVRSASRGTPNCYLRDAYDYFAEWENKLVRVECTRTELKVREATQAEAEAFWAKLKPAPVAVPEPDLAYTELVDMPALDVASKEARALAVTRFGAKGMNLAWLRQNLAPELTPPGFLVPLAHYHAFLTGQSWTVDLGDGAATHTFAETLDRWFADEAFLRDGKLRRERLTALQAAMEGASCDATLIDAIEQHIVAVFGTDTQMVRLRSSSNAEDGAFFNGAGLYDSFSGCIADDRDADETGPSRCDANKDEEKGVCTALKRVWASLWNVKAVEERAFYGIDPKKVAMAVLVNERSEAELANMVAFTGNPVQKNDGRYLVNAQKGELAVVSPDPGVWPEQDLLRVKDGAVTEIIRAGQSSEVGEGEHVLSDALLRELGGHLAELVRLYPGDATPPEGHDFLLDTEWKVMPGGKLRIKQIRPFLR